MEVQMMANAEEIGTFTVPIGNTENVDDTLREKGLVTSENNEAKVADTVVDEKSTLDVPKPRKKHRRGSKRNKPRKPRQKYKPYNKLTWEEKRKLDELDAVKAVKRREELVLQKGRAIAPYNTTQFLMDEHDPGDHNGFQTNTEHHHHAEHDDSSSSYSSDEYFEKDFEDFYDRVHIDTLNSYSKEDLIKNVYELEKRIELLEKDARSNENVKHLQEENIRLTLENEELKKKALNSS